VGDVVINPWMREDAVAIFDGKIHAASLSAVLAQIERERRRADVLAVWPPLDNEPASGVQE
jgi:hypothetical protein